MGEWQMKKLSAPDIDGGCMHSVVNSRVKSFQVRSKYVIARPSYDRAQLLIHFSAYKRNSLADSRRLSHLNTPAKFVA